MKLRYVGRKPMPYTVLTPIPFISKSYQEGELIFSPEAEVRDDWAKYLLEFCAGAFERVDAPQVIADQAPRPLCQADIEKILKYVGKRFSGKAGKWNAIAFIKKHHADEILGMRKLQIMTKVVHWELVPIALADVKVGDLPEIWNKGKKMKPDAITEESAGIETTPVPVEQEG